MPQFVLIVDDSPQMAANLEIALTTVPGVEVAIAASGGEALRMLDAASSVAAVVTDLELPVVDGSELIERLRAAPRFARVPVIVSSGSVDPHAAERVRLLGADDFFLKPYSPAELKQRLEQLLHEKQI